MLKEILQSVRYAYVSDDTKAGVVISQLGLDKFYVSVCRYPNGPTSKTVIVSAKDTTLDRALAACAVAWIVERGRTNELSKELDGELAKAAKRVLKV